MSSLTSISLRTKIALLVGIVVILTGLFGMAVTREIIANALKKGLEERGLAVATSLAARSADPILQGRFFELHTILQEARANSRDTDIRYAFVLDPRGNLVDHTFEEGFPSDLLDLPRPGSGQAYEAKLLETEAELIRDIAVPILDGRAGVLHVGISQRSMDEAVGEAELDLFLAALVALFVGIMLSWLLADLATRPILKLVKVAEAVRGGNLAHRASLSSKDEVGRLGSAFDAMTEQLVLRIRDLEITTGQVSTLNRIAVLATKTADLDRMFDEILQKMLELVNADAAAVLTWDQQRKLMKCNAQRGFSEAYVKYLESTIQPEEKDASLARVEGDRSPEFGEVKPAAGTLAVADGLQAVVNAVFYVKGKARGQLHIASREKCTFSSREIELLSGVAGQLGIALENLELISEANQAAALRQLNQMKSEFVVRASHELRTPVTAIKGYIETLLRPDMELSRSEETQMLADIDDVSDRLIRLVQDLLNVSRLESGRLDVKKERLALRPLIQKVARRNARQNTRHRLSVRISGNVGEAIGDSDRIEDVLDNLISNAIKYSPKGGNIILRAVNQSSLEANGAMSHLDGFEPARERMSCVTISVKDEGIGIPAEQLPKLFQQFYQVSPKLGVRSGGIGVGLYICRSYVEAMGGRIWVESVEGEGSTFHFSLPVVAATRGSNPGRVRNHSEAVKRME